MIATARTFRPALLLLLAGLLGACGAAPPPPPSPTLVEITFIAAPDVNPDPSGRASPIVVRYYQLAATGAFEMADYFQLHDTEAAVLGQNLLDRQELALAPGTSQTVAFAVKPGTQSVGVAASYRNIDRAQWRAAAPVAEGKKTKLKVQLDTLTLSITPDAK
jgi:type VI secretion system protein VasD